ncbi:hypothetical protein FA15DRAFT_708436 [Coprinopsis marcescibilis]|uniref:Uncharacterized protein n=1 Tax=Coprinopsis marcescibilis TaxID=230819 RepID=A0A5C3KIH1_COPMA|nr:hypothetical protein FA15DRAFT_708436 [Coprinopsis marcescibilis]
MADANLLTQGQDHIPGLPKSTVNVPHPQHYLLTTETKAPHLPFSNSTFQGIQLQPDQEQLARLTPFSILDPEPHQPVQDWILDTTNQLDVVQPTDRQPHQALKSTQPRQQPGHIARVLTATTRAEHWTLWLGYDIEVRCRAIRKPLDPQYFHKDVWDTLQLRYFKAKASTSSHQESMINPQNAYPPLLAQSGMTAATRNPEDVSSVETHTLMPPKPAEQPPTSKDNLATSPSEIPASHPATFKAKLTALLSMGTPVAGVDQPANSAGTGVPSAATSCTAPNHAHLSDLTYIITPFIADAWATAISSLDPCNQDRFNKIPSLITHGFDMGVHSTLDHCYMPNNHASSLQQPQAVCKHINTELSL